MPLIRVGPGLLLGLLRLSAVRPLPQLVNTSKKSSPYTNLRSLDFSSLWVFACYFVPDVLILQSLQGHDLNFFKKIMFQCFLLSLLGVMM